MEKLKQNDCFIGGTENQYKEIVTVNYKTSPTTTFWNNVRKEEIRTCNIRGGVFWSDRIKNIVPAKLESGNKLPFKEFLERLKNTVNN